MSARGQPTHNTQAKTNDTIRFYFERGIGETECSAKTGYSWRTVHARYQKWFDLINSRKDEQFLLEQDKAKAQALMALDKQITELLSIQQQISQGVIQAQGQAEKAKRPMVKAEIEATMRAKLSWLIADITDKKAALAMTPTVAEKVRQEVQAYIDKYQKQPVVNEIKQLSK